MPANAPSIPDVPLADSRLSSPGVARLDLSGKLCPDIFKINRNPTHERYALSSRTDMSGSNLSSMEYHFHVSANIIIAHGKLGIINWRKIIPN